MSCCSASEETGQEGEARRRGSRAAGGRAAGDGGTDRRVYERNALPEESEQQKVDRIERGSRWQRMRGHVQLDMANGTPCCTKEGS